MQNQFFFCAILYLNLKNRRLCSLAQQTLLQLYYTLGQFQVSLRVIGVGKSKIVDWEEEMGSVTVQQILQA